MLRCPAHLLDQVGRLIQGPHRPSFLTSRAILTTALFVEALVGEGEASPGFILTVSARLWSTVLVANFADALPRSWQETSAQKLLRPAYGATYNKFKPTTPHNASEASTIQRECLARGISITA